MFPGFRERRLRKKISKYQKQCLENPADIALHLRVAQLHMELGETENAADRYRQAIRILRNSGEPLSNANASGWLINLYQQLIAVAPLDVEAYNGLGETYCERREFSKALEVYTSLLQRLIQAGKYREALAQCANMLVLDSNNISIRETYAGLLYRLGMLEKGAAEWKEIAELYLLQNKPEEALTSYFKALELTPLDRGLQEKLLKLSGSLKLPKPAQAHSVDSSAFPEKLPLSEPPEKGNPLEVKPSDARIPSSQPGGGTLTEISKGGFHGASLKKLPFERDRLEASLRKVLESKERAEKLLATVGSLQPDQDPKPLWIAIKQRIADLEAIELEIRGQISTR